MSTCSRVISVLKHSFVLRIVKENIICFVYLMELNYYPLIPLREKLIGDIAQRNEDRKKVKEIVEMMDELIYDEDEDEDEDDE